MKVTKWIVEDGIDCGKRSVKVQKHTAELEDFTGDIVPYFDTFEEAALFCINALFDRVLELETEMEKWSKRYGK